MAISTKRLLQRNVRIREAGDRAQDRPGGHAEAPNFHLHGNSDDDQVTRFQNRKRRWNGLRRVGVAWLLVSVAVTIFLLIF